MINNRLIEFRAWISPTATQEGYMAYQGEPDLETIQAFMFHYGDKPLMQFTGILDIGKQKIWEHDIIAANYKGNEWRLTYIIVWHPTMFWVAYRKNVYHTLDSFDFLKVIRNIHENPLFCLDFN